MVLTSQKSLYTKGIIVMDAWAKQCDNFKLITLLPNLSTKNTTNFTSNNASSSTNLTNPDKNNNNNNNTRKSKLNYLLKQNRQHQEMLKTFDYSSYILQPPGLVNDTYDGLTEKVFLTYKYVYAEYGDYDWYLKADDDTFVFMENLRTFLADKNSSQPVTFG